MAKKGNLKRETESLLIASQNRTIKTMSKKKSTRHNKLADVDYAAIETKRSIT